MRNMAIYEDKLFVTTSDARMVALDARTGVLRVGDAHRRHAQRASTPATGPIVINGKLLQGLNGCDRFKEDGCYISAFDAATGKLLWQFNTVARPDEPGGDTWGKQPMMFRAGGETWITGSYDPDLNLTYWGTAQAKPWVPASRGMTVARQGAVHELHARAESRHRQARVVLPACARRGARPRRSLRARARRRRRRASSCSRSASPAFSGSSIGRPASSSGTRRPSSRTSSTASIRRPACRRIAATSSKRRSASGSPRARARRAATTGRR